MLEIHKKSYQDVKPALFNQETIRRTLFGENTTEPLPLLAEHVGNWNTGVQFTKAVRDTVSAYITPRIPLIKQANPYLAEESDRNIRDAVVDHVFWRINTRDKEKVSLLLKLGDAVSRIETKTAIDTLKVSSEDDLAKIGLNPATRDLTVDLLQASTTVNPLFARFMELSRDTPQPDTADAAALFLPGDNNPHTIVDVFPEESRTIADAFSNIAQQETAWSEEEHGGAFRDYISTISDFYRETDPQKAKFLQDKITDLYTELLKTNFPVILTPGLMGYYMPPVIDPELKVSIASPDAIGEDNPCAKARDLMAENLDVIGAQEFTQSVKEAEIKTIVTLGGYGVNLYYPAPAQSQPLITRFLGEQMSREDKDFPSYMELIKNTDHVFKDIPDEEKRKKMEYMNRMNTALHEFSHKVHPREGVSSRKFGEGKTFTTIDEIKADIIYRGMLKTLCVKGGLEESPEQWAVASLASALQGITYGEDDPYFHSSSYALNNIFAKGVVKIEDKRFVITDYDAYFRTLQEDAVSLLDTLYIDPSVNESKAASWIREHARPNQQVLDALQIIKQI